MNTKCEFRTGSGWHCIMDAHPTTPTKHYMRYETMYIEPHPEPEHRIWIATAATYAVFIGAMTLLTIVTLAWFGAAS